MSSVLIVYASSLGNTRRMAEAIAAGVHAIAPIEIKLGTPEEISTRDVADCDALVLGSPVRHGSVDSRLRHFIEMDCESLARSGRLASKLGAVFSVGGHFNRHGDGGEVAQIVLLRALAAAGMTLITAACADDPQGPYWGPHARLRMLDNGREELQPDALDTAYAHGRRIGQTICTLGHMPVAARTKRWLRWPRRLDFFFAALR
jgi:NAD(P)H dehydrogenase (quinone)